MRLLCLSDIHGEAAGLETVLTRDPGIDIVVIVGDITHLGDYADAETVLGPLIDSGVAMVAVGGNMDREGARRFLQDKGIDIHARGVMLHGVGFMGLGGGTKSPFRTPWELLPEEAERCLASGFSAIADAPFKVLVSHAPPHATAIDTTSTHLHAGSVPVREFLLGGSIDLCICGHVHEARGEDRLGGTTCVNVGPYKNGRYALITVGRERAGAAGHRAEAAAGDRVEITWRTR